MRRLVCSVWMAANLFAAMVQADDAGTRSVVETTKRLNEAAVAGAQADDRKVCFEKTTPRPRPQITERVIYEAEVPFNVNSDGLCFLNEGFSSGPWPLDEVASAYGACAGMSGTVSAFKRFAHFTCEGRKPDAYEANYLLKDVLTADDESRSIEIQGYCSLHEFCRDNRRLFRKRVVQYNADFSLQRSLEHLFELKAGATSAAQVGNMSTIADLYHALKKGTPQLLLYPWHVVLVTGIRIRQFFVPGRADYKVARYEANIEFYDPNDLSKKGSRTFRIQSDFKRTVQEAPIFNVSP